MEELIHAILVELGLDPDQDAGIAETPKRVAKMLRSFTQGGVLRDELGTVFRSPYTASASHKMPPMVVQDKIPFRGLCEHHLLPFYGEAALGYIPTDKIVGLSKLVRLVQAAGVQRPSIQERITNDIADTLHGGLNAAGAIVVVKAEHMCMAVRGVNAPGVRTMTSALRGLFEEDTAARAEFYSLVAWSK